MVAVLVVGMAVCVCVWPPPLSVLVGHLPFGPWVASVCEPHPFFFFLSLKQIRDQHWWHHDGVFGGR